MAKLKDEIRQTKAFTNAKHEAFLAMQRTADLIARPVERIFSKYKLTPEQYNVLRILRGSEPSGMPTLEIGRRMITRASNVTRIVDRLEIKDLVTRKRDTVDRRVVQIRINHKGLSLLKKMQSNVDDATMKSMSGLSNQETARLNAVLEKIRLGLEKLQPKRLSRRRKAER